MSDSKPTVRFAPNGPLIVEDLTKMQGAAGPIGCQPKMALCRCGGSQNKPFCDGAHAKNGFSSEKSADRAADKIDDYIGKEITIHDNRSVCAHAGVCTERLPTVWRLKQEPWIDADGASAREIIEVVRSCPSGALSYTRQDAATEAAEATDSEPGECSVFVAPGGPYAISGMADLDGQAPGAGSDPDHVTLCRCGASKNKPFCDGTHWHVKFDETAG